ncbi:hypothetical protein [Sinomicrobium sp. M5D2P9]
MKKLIYVISGFFIISCSNGTDDAVELQGESLAKNERVSFNNFDEFIVAYNELAEMNTTDELDSWIAEKGHNSLLKHLSEINRDTTDIEISGDTIYDKYSQPFKAVLNDKMEFEVGGKVVKLSEDGMLYQATKTSGKESIVEKGEKIGTVMVQGPDRKKSVESQARTFKPNGDIFAQHNFNATSGFQCSVGKVGKKRERGFYHRIYDETISQNGNVVSRKLYLETRLFGKYCSFWRCKWRDVGNESRHVNINVRTTIGSETTTVNRQFSCAEGTVNVVLRNFSSPSNNSYNASFSGTIEQTHLKEGGVGNYKWSQNAATFN